jgi:RNA polymerase sigma-70 factor (ECF subfamily)
MLISLNEADQASATQYLIQQWFMDYAGELSQHLDRLVGNSTTAEDLLQDTFVRAMKAVDPGRPPANPRAWLYAIASNLAVDHIRHRYRWHWLLSSFRPESPTVEQQVLVNHAIRRCLAALKPQDAEVLILIRYAGYSPTEVATLTGEPLTTIRKRLFRAGERFRQLHIKETMQ